MHKSGDEAFMKRIPLRYIALAGGAALGLTAAMVARSRKRLASLRGQVVLITGGSRGLGLALAREFGKRGCSLAICSRTAEQLDDARDLLEAEGYRVFAIPCDVTDPIEVRNLISEVHKSFSRIDILVNNAGEILVGPLENMTVADFERAMDVMFWGVVNMTFEVLPEMRERGSGSIATVTSVGGKVSVPHLTPYCCAKFAAVAFSEGLRAEMAPLGIKVTTVAPGLMRTGGDVNARFKGDQEAEAAWFSVAASLPVLSMDAERAAAKIVGAIADGESEIVLSPQADMMSRLNGLFPGLVPDILGFVNRLLPAPTSGFSLDVKGLDLARARDGILKFLTAGGKRAGERLNQASV
jgi:NAD(P)-dependent dehydrogenase (short-subunit alcohol dehydrogenase family)